MLQKTGHQFYELTAADGVGLRVTGNGVNFFVPASVDVTAINLQDGIQFPITAQVLNGSGSYHQVNLHCFYTAGSAPGAAYDIEVSDLASGTPVDTLVAAMPAGQQLSQSYYQLILWVL